MLLENKVAIITDAGSGFGRATAELFAKEGAKIVVVDYNEEAAKETVDQIKNNIGEAVAVKADVSNEDDVKTFINTTVSEYGQIDILFNNAGVYAAGNAENTIIDAWQRSLLEGFCAKSGSI